MQRSRLVVPRLSRRRFLYASGLASAGLLLNACGGDEQVANTSGEDPADATGGESPVAAESNAAIVPLTIGVNNPNYASQMLFYIAADQGYYDEVGITEWEALESEEYIPGLIGGSLQMTQGDTDVLIGSAAASGEPLLFLGTYRGKEYRLLGVGPGIDTVEDLVGGNVSGGSLDDRNTFLMRLVLTELGIDPESDVEIVPLEGNSDARLQALIAGQLQGGSIFPRHVEQLEAAGGKVLYQEIFDVPQEGIAVMGPFLEENRRSVVAFLTANLRARQYIYEDPEGVQDSVIALMREEGFEIPEEFEALFPIEVEQISADGGFEADEMDEFIAQAIELEAAPPDTDWRAHIDLGPLWEAQEAVGLPQRPAPDSIER